MQLQGRMRRRIQQHESLRSSFFIVYASAVACSTFLRTTPCGTHSDCWGGVHASPLEEVHRAQILAQLRRNNQQAQTGYFDHHLGESLLPVQELKYPDNHRMLQQQQNESATGGVAQSENMRFHFVTEPLEKQRNEANSDLIDNILNNVLPQVAATWSKYLLVTPVANDTFIGWDHSSCLGYFGGDQYDDLTPGVVTGKDVAILVAGYDKVRFPINPYETMTPNNTNAINLCLVDLNVLATAFPCAVDQFDRPILGVLNFCLYSDKSTDNSTVTQLYQQLFGDHLQVEFRDSDIAPDLVAIAMHEVAHVLAFNAELFKYFRTPDGTPRTARPFTVESRVCPDGTQLQGYFPSTATVDIRSVNGRSSFYFLTPRVTQVIRNMIGCPTLDGARLQDIASLNHGDNDFLAAASFCMGAHWHEREMYGELMGPLFSDSSQNVLTALTLALMEDSGWYAVEYRGLPPQPSYGLITGCDFVQQDCIQNDIVPDFGTGAFCNVPIIMDSPTDLSKETETAIMCDPSYRYWTLCDLYDLTVTPYVIETSSYYDQTRYFSNQNYAVRSPYADACPVPMQQLGLDCRKDRSSFFYPGESIGGPDSFCVQTSYVDETSEARHRPACFEIECDARNGQVIVHVGSNVQVVCEETGQLLDVTSIDSVSGASRSFHILCPRLPSVCPRLYSCPAACSGRGTCILDGPFAYCNCTESSTIGKGCYPENVQPSSQPPTPSTESILNSNATTSPIDDIPTKSPVSIPLESGTTLSPTLIWSEGVDSEVGSSTFQANSTIMISPYRSPTPAPGHSDRMDNGAVETSATITTSPPLLGALLSSYSCLFILYQAFSL